MSSFEGKKGFWLRLNLLERGRFYLLLQHPSTVRVFFLTFCTTAVKTNCSSWDHYQSTQAWKKHDDWNIPGTTLAWYNALEAKKAVVIQL